jgi:hypothetical protein
VVSFGCPGPRPAEIQLTFVSEDNRLAIGIAHCCGSAQAVKTVLTQEDSTNSEFATVTFSNA